MSDHFLVEEKLGIGRKWVKTRRLGEAMRAMKLSEINKKEKIEEYQGRIECGEGEKSDVEEEWQLYRGVWYEKSER